MNLIGLHDRSSVAISAPNSWIVDTIALSEKVYPQHYDSRFNWIVRVNWGYGSTGTIPLPENDLDFINRLTVFVRESKNCKRWVVGNEPNLSREWPDKQPIYPARYAAIYSMCRKAIKNIPGHEQDEVLIAASGPWNAELKYQGNSIGDWIKYFTDVIGYCGSEIDGFSLHAYTHGYNKDLVWSDATMDPPFQNRHYNFRTYRDYCLSIPEKLKNLPIYITEANGDGPWVAVGLMKYMALEINSWNKISNGRKILSLVFYRYSKDDTYNIDGKSDVIEEYHKVASMGVNSPEITIQSSQQVFLPSVEKKENLTIPITDNDTRWQRSREFVSGWEGGFQAVHNDRGNWTGCEVGKGELRGTKYGISACSYPHLDIKNLTYEQATEIFYRDYWLKSGANDLPWPTCLLIYDTAVLHGVNTAKAWLKEIGPNPYLFAARRLRSYTKAKNFDFWGKAWVLRVADLLERMAT